MGAPGKFAAQLGFSTWRRDEGGDKRPLWTGLDPPTALTGHTTLGTHEAELGFRGVLIQEAGLRVPHVEFMVIEEPPHFLLRSLCQNSNVVAGTK